MFAKPRPKKSILPPPSKKRKTSNIEEISFDNDARQEYLTGFHKRKQQRIKYAQEQAAKQARQDKLETRKQAREERKREVEEHVKAVNEMLVKSGAIEPEKDDEESQEEDAEEWEGIPDKPDLEMVDHEEEYIDEDRYTTVTVESVGISRYGLEKPAVPKDSEDEDDEKKETKEEETSTSKGKESSKFLKKKKQPKFRYENKHERQATSLKQKARNKAKRS